MFKVKKNIQKKVVIEKSKFISFIYNCNSRDEQTSILKSLNSQYSSATHICYASIIYDNPNILTVSNEDKEPSGTAGSQILQALKENDMINVLCVVVRYFGGIKLGIAGLGRAYKESALSCIINNKVEVSLKRKYKLMCDYNNFNKLQQYIELNNLESNITFENKVIVELFLNNDELNFITNQIKIENLEELNEVKYC